MILIKTVDTIEDDKADQSLFYLLLISTECSGVRKLSRNTAKTFKFKETTGKL